MMLIVHIHLLARSMMSETIIELVGGELDVQIAELGPLCKQAQQRGLPEDYPENARFVGVSHQGYVQAIEFAELVTIAQRANVLVVLSFRAGDYMTAQGHQIGVYPAERAAPYLVEEIVRTFTIGVHRTPVQDLEFSIRHLVEIAARALSPGVNDPYTAAAVVDRLSASLSRLMMVGMPAADLRDPAGKVRVICERPTYASLVGAAFDQIRQSGADKPMVLIRLAQAITRISDAVGVADQLDVLRSQLNLIGETNERRVEMAHDRDAVSGRVNEAQEALRTAQDRIAA